MSNKQRILIGVDRSQASFRAVEYVPDLAGGTPGFQVGLAHLELRPRMLEWGGAENPSIEATESAARAEEYRHLEAAAVEQGETLVHRLQ